jgi:cytochrome oxidase assembly protein ShyY1
MKARDPLAPLLGILLAILALLSLFVAIGVWRLGSKTDERACIEAAQARYPAVSVSAFVTRDRSASGPLKLSFVRERQRAVAECD